MHKVASVYLIKYPTEGTSRMVHTIGEDKLVPGINHFIV